MNDISDELRQTGHMAAFPNRPAQVGFDLIIREVFQSADKDIHSSQS
ncbi:MAG: hypothetical protein U0930_02090 [Pirellulales bacterium]